MKLSLGVVTAMPVSDSLALAKAAEEAGYHRVWVGEDIFHRELFTYLAVLTMNTRSIGLASGITSPFVRNQQVLLGSCRAINELGGGRFTIGLGAGGLPEVRRLTGEGPKNTVEVLEKTARLLRDRLGLEVYLGVRGPKMLALVGRIGDGVLLSGPQGYIREAVGIVDDAGDGRDVKKALWNAFYLGENPELVSKITSVMMESMPNFALEHMDRQRASEELCISGSIEEVKNRVSEFEAMGIDEFVVGPPYGRDPVSVIKELGEEFGDSN